MSFDPVERLIKTSCSSSSGRSRYQSCTCDYAERGWATRVPKEFVLNTELPLPPLAEQRRIVAEDSRHCRNEVGAHGRPLRSGATAGAVPQLVSGAAFRGDLTADWRAAHPNVEPASEFLRRILAERRRRWEQAELAEYEAKVKSLRSTGRISMRNLSRLTILICRSCRMDGFGPPLTKSARILLTALTQHQNGPRKGKLCVRTTEFHPGKLDLANARFVSQETFEERIRRLNPQPGDVLYSREGGILGISCQIPTDTELCLGQRMMLMRTDVNFLSRLLMHWLNSPRTLDRVKRLTLGSASPHLNVGEVKRFPVPVAPLDEQSKLLKQIESCLATPEVCGQMAMDYEQQLDYLDQAIFSKAFRVNWCPRTPTTNRRQCY